MVSRNDNNSMVFNRGTGLLIIEVRHSNPNGDPDSESDPRTLDSDQRGLISPVSLKRKLRDLIADEKSPVWQEASRALKIITNGNRKYGILETRGRDLKAIFQMPSDKFIDAFWDARIFGNTTLEDMKDKKIKPGEKDHFIRTGVVQFGPGVSIAPIEIERLTTTKMASVEEGKTRGMAPLGWRVVRHAVYAMPFFVNPMMAGKTGCNALDIELMKFVIPQAYRNTASAIRPFVEVRHAWYAEHTSPLGSCPDSLILDILTPKKVRGDANVASLSIEEYEMPTSLSENIQQRLANFEDLCAKKWE